MKKLKLIRKQTPALIDFILDTWRGYMILSVSRFSWSRRKLGVFQHVITVIFCLLFLRVMFVKETFDIAMSKSKLLLFITYTLSVFCSMSAVNNSCLFVKTGIDINLSYSKAATICQIKDIPSLLRLFLKKAGPKLVNIWNWICANCRMQKYCAGIVRVLFSLLCPGLNYLIMQ